MKRLAPQAGRFCLGSGVVFREILLALALVLFLEGALYALFPDGMKRMMVSVLQTPSSVLRTVGLCVAVIGVITAWLIKL